MGQTNTKGAFVIQAEGYVDGSNAGGSGIQLWTKDVSGPKQGHGHQKRWKGRG
jgi:hypothetical protein